MIAGAPAIERVEGEVHLVLNTILTPDDIRETLATLAGHGRVKLSNQPGGHDVFAFGIPNRGRFRVQYLTQRGSLALSIQRIPFEIPRPEELLATPSQIADADTLFRPNRNGIVLLTGASPAAVVRFAYSMISRVNDLSRHIICVVERHLSYALRHHNSIVAQIEAEFDVPDIAEGIRSALHLDPDILYVRDCQTREDFNGLVCATESGALVITTAVAFNTIHFLDDARRRLQEDFDRFGGFILQTVELTANREGKVSFFTKGRPDLATAKERRP